LVTANLKFYKDSSANHTCCLKPGKTFTLSNNTINNILSDKCPEVLLLYDYLTCRKYEKRWKFTVFERTQK